jgi:hypothetical protein
MATLKTLSCHSREKPIKITKSLRRAAVSGIIFTRSVSGVSQACSRSVSLPGAILCSFLHCITTDAAQINVFRTGVVLQWINIQRRHSALGLGRCFAPPPALPLMQKTMKPVLLVGRFRRVPEQKLVKPRDIKNCK